MATVNGSLTTAPLEAQEPDRVLTNAESALREAVVELASGRSVARLSVAEVCRKAGISRDSFYRFASSPEELLAAHLYDDHDVSVALPGSAGTAPTVRELAPAIRVLIEHVQRNIGIYTNAIDPHFPPNLQDALLRRFTEVLEAHASAFPEKLPQIGEGEPSSVAKAALVNYVAFATLGAVESLVRSNAIGDSELATQILKSAIAPSWMAYD